MAKWVEEGGRPLEQVNPYQNEAENIIGCHGKPTSKKPPSLTHCVMWLLVPIHCAELEGGLGSLLQAGMNVWIHYVPQTFFFPRIFDNYFNITL